MATPNYGYEKRQKELAKKRKKEDKLKAKAARKSGEAGQGGADDADAQQQEPTTGSEPGGQPQP